MLKMVSSWPACGRGDADPVSATMVSMDSMNLGNIPGVCPVQLVGQPAGFSGSGLLPPRRLRR